MKAYSYRGCQASWWIKKHHKSGLSVIMPNPLCGKFEHVQSRIRFESYGRGLFDYHILLLNEKEQLEHFSKHISTGERNHKIGSTQRRVNNFHLSYLGNCTFTQRWQGSSHFNDVFIISRDFFPFFPINYFNKFVVVIKLVPLGSPHALLWSV